MVESSSNASVGGASPFDQIIRLPHVYDVASRGFFVQVAGMLSWDGHCKTLDASADGYVRAEAVIVLRMDTIPADGATTSSYQLRGVILRGTFVNQDGRSSSLTAPNGPAQQAVIHGTLQAADLAAGDVTGLEMHGTGTSLGDDACPHIYLTIQVCYCNLPLLTFLGPMYGFLC